MKPPKQSDDVANKESDATFEVSGGKKNEGKATRENRVDDK